MRNIRLLGQDEDLMATVTQGPVPFEARQHSTHFVRVPAQQPELAQGVVS